MRLKRWTLAMGKRERERLQSLQNLVPLTDLPQPRKELDEIACERGVELLPERGGMWSIISCVIMFPSRGFQSHLAVVLQFNYMPRRMPRQSNISRTESISSVHKTIFVHLLGPCLL
jgi:hypothetical protein